MYQRKEHIIYKFFRGLILMFKKKPEVLDLSGEATEPRLYIANHSAANGPLTFELYFPHKFRPWGAHQMCGNYKERWDYLYYIFYQQKLHFGKVPAFILATLFAIISKALYGSVGLIPTFQDLRMKETLKESADTLADGNNVLIFPENSNDGYHQVLTEYHAGFVKLAKLFRKKTGKDVPICTVYFSGKVNKMVIDKPVYLEQIVAENGLENDKAVAAFFCNHTNRLADKYVLG